MSYADKLYSRLPILLQQAAVAGYGWWWYHQRYNSHFYHLVAELKQRESWSSEEFRRFQASLLSQLFVYAEKSPYYQKVFNLVEGNNSTSPFEFLHRLPFLTKETLRTNSKALITGKPPKSTRVFKSSGTTGTPTVIYYSPQFHALELAVPAARNFSWAGVDYRARRVMFGVRKVCRFDQDKPPFWRFSPVENLAYASIYHLSPEYLASYVEFLNEYKPEIIMGYPNALAVVARYALDNDKSLQPAKGIFTTSETVTEPIRKLLETAWGCKVYDRYGAVEGCMFASQCEYGKYHVSPDVGIIEILDEDGNECPLGTLGEVVVTGLHNTLQPLIRYRIGDMARWAVDQTCQCKRNMPILEAIEGRVEDMCITPDGRSVLRFDTVFKGIESIKEAQIIQEKEDLFKILVVPGDGFDGNDIELLKTNMRMHVGDVTTYVTQVDQIARTSSGKFRAVISNVQRPELRTDE